MFCVNCGNQIPDGAAFCPACGTRVNRSFNNDNLTNLKKQNQPSQQPIQKQKKKPIPLRWWFWVLVVIVSLIAWGSAPSTESDASSVGNTSEATPQKEDTAPQYKTNIEWALLESYKCAVERDDYPGDVIAAGTYIAELTCAENLSGTDVPIVWSIYVSDNDYSSASEMKEEELVAVVGGWELDAYKITVAPGQYVYCIYPNTAGNPRGILELTLIES